MITLLKQILTRKEITKAEACLLSNDNYVSLNDLLYVAHEITQYYHQKNVEMCAIYPAKIGSCSNDCAFCSQSSYHTCDIVESQVSNIAIDFLVSKALTLQNKGVSRLSLVTSGEQLNDEEFAQILAIYRRLHHETKLRLCASLGTLTKERAKELVDVGVTRYHHNIETAPSFFPSICTTHSFKDKLSTLLVAREAGLEICCGGIISMGETMEQRIEIAFTLKDLDVDCIPFNILNPIKGTRLENQPLLNTAEILRTIALFRLILPTKTIRFAGGRQNALADLEYKGYEAGINALMVGDFLTTTGTELQTELELLSSHNISVKAF